MNHVEPTLPAPMPPSTIDFAAVFAVQAEQAVREAELRPANASRTADIDGYHWDDGRWLQERARKNTDSDGRRNVATAVGAAGGAVAGNAIQNRVEGNRAGSNIHVRMDDGRTTVIHQADVRGLRNGTYVRVQNGYVQAY